MREGLQCLSVSGSAQIEATGPWSPIKDLWTPSLTKIRAVRPHFWVLWVKVQFSHYNQWERQMPINWKLFKVKNLIFIPNLHNDKTFCW